MKEPTVTLSISAASYNEIAAALEKKGMKLGENVGVLQLERGTKLEQPIDYRLATIRKDAALIAARICQGNPNILIIDMIDEIYQYIINGKQLLEPFKTEWK